MLGSIGSGLGPVARPVLGCRVAPCEPGWPPPTAGEMSRLRAGLKSSIRRKKVMAFESTGPQKPEDL